MPSTIDTLIGRVPDPQLRAELSAAADELRKTTDFGLVFEAHIPETVQLPHHALRRGVKATYRGSTDKSIFEILAIDGSTAVIRRIRHAGGAMVVPGEETDSVEAQLDELVVVAEFGDAIYPGLKHIGSIRNGADKPAHVVIKGENHHALEAMQFTHEGSVDCIYIDPPYNTGGGSRLEIRQRLRRCRGHLWTQHVVGLHGTSPEAGEATPKSGELGTDCDH